MASESSSLFLRRDEWLSMSEEELVDYMERIYVYYRERGFPYYPTDDAWRREQVRKMCNYDARRCVDVDNKRIKQVFHGQSLCWSFHPYYVTIQCQQKRTPYALFQDDVLFKKAIHRMIKMSKRVNDGELLSILRIFDDTQCVSNFRPTAAAAIYHHFAPPGGTVLDMSSGFGGRALGAFAANMRYIGFDPSTRAHQGVSDMCRFLGYTNAQLYCQCSEDPMPVASNSVDLCFTSPPYYDCEKYSDEPTQAYIRYPTIEQWSECYLGGTFRNCYRVLKPGGCMLINIQNHHRAPTLVQDTMEQAARARFTLEDTWSILFSKRRGVAQKANLGTHKQEPLFVFRK